MATAVYDHTAYAALSSLENASDTFIARGAEKAIDGQLKDVLVKHGLTAKYGLSLLHSHAEILPHERLAHFGNSAIPVSIKEIPPTSLLPCTWKVSNDGLLPLEFYFSPSNPPALMEPNELAFVEDITMAIFDLGLEDLIGLSLLASESTGGHLSGIEITEGRCNITLPHSTFGNVEGNDIIDALWIFNPIGHKQCKKACKKRGNEHKLVHQMTGK